MTGMPVIQNKLYMLYKYVRRYNLVRETDARGNETHYTVDNQTSRNEEVTDLLGNKTAYEYDASGRTTKVTSKKADCTEHANVFYAYDSFYNMTEITCGDGIKYALTYNAFHNLESIGVQGKNDKLIKYDYKNGNGRLKQIQEWLGHSDFSTTVNIKNSHTRKNLIAKAA